MQVTSQPIVNSTRLGMLLFLAAEAMFFAGLISAYLVFRIGAVSWPPVGSPRLSVFLAGGNTAIFLIGLYTMRQAFQNILAGMPQKAAHWLYPTIVIGLVFIGLLTYEWGVLYDQGFTLSSGVYGFTFYTLTGAHALHTVAAVLWLPFILVKTSMGRFSAEGYNGFDACRMYWYFVVGTWSVLFGLVYIF